MHFEYKFKRSIYEVIQYILNFLWIQQSMSARDLILKPLSI